MTPEEGELIYLHTYSTLMNVKGTKSIFNENSGVFQGVQSCI